MDATTLLKLAADETRDALLVAQRASRLSAILCTYDDLCASVPDHAGLLLSRLCYLFRQPEFPRDVLLNMPSKDSWVRVLRSIYEKHETGSYTPKKTPQLHEIEQAKTFFPFILSSVMHGEVSLSAMIKSDGSKQWLARVNDLNPEVISAVSFGLSGVEVKNYPIAALKEKNISLWDASNKDARDAFMREYSQPPARNISDQIVSATSAYVVPQILRMKDRYQIRNFVSQLPDEPYLSPLNIPKQTLN